MSLKAWLSEWYNGLFHPFDDLPPEAFMTSREFEELMISREFEELFAATEEEEWEDANH